MTQTVQSAPPGHYRVSHVVKSEVAKILTLRSTAITLGVTVLFSLVVTGLATNSALHHDPRFYTGFDPTQQALIGMIVAGLTGGVFGAMLITGEFASGTIRTTLAATPRRQILLSGKIGVAAAAALAFCELLSFASFFVGEVILASGGAPHASLNSPGAFRAVFMTGMFIALLALMAFGLGLILRSTAAAIAAFVGIVFVLPLVMHTVSESDVRYLPTSILTNSIMSTTNQIGGQFGPISPTFGMSLMLLYSAIALIVGSVMFSSRDA